MSNKSKKGFNGTPQARSRRERVVARLEAQLKLGTKQSLVTTEGGSATWQNIPLETKDVERIKKELEILKTRI